VFSFEMDFTVAPIQQVDLTLPAQQGAISGIQTLYIDNSTNDVAVVVRVQATNQRLPIGAGQAGYFPIMAASSSLKFTFDGTGSTVGTQVFVALLNVPVGAVDWYPYDTHSHG
jgi:hypothetical protein